MHYIHKVDVLPYVILIYSSQHMMYGTHRNDIPCLTIYGSVILQISWDAWISTKLLRNVKTKSIPWDSNSMKFSLPVRNPPSGFSRFKIISIWIICKALQIYNELNVLSGSGSYILWCTVTLPLPPIQWVHTLPFKAPPFFFDSFLDYHLLILNCSEKICYHSGVCMDRNS